MNIKLRLAEEGELEVGPARGPTLEFVLGNEEVLLKEEEEEELRGKQQFCTTENERTEPCSAKSAQSLDTDIRTDTNPWPPLTLLPCQLLNGMCLRAPHCPTAHGALTDTACMFTTDGGASGSDGLTHITTLRRWLYSQSETVLCIAQGIRDCNAVSENMLLLPKP